MKTGMAEGKSAWLHYKRVQQTARGEQMKCPQWAVMILLLGLGPPWEPAEEAQHYL